MSEPIPGKPKKFYQLSLAERMEQLARESGLPSEMLLPLSGEAGLKPEQADHMVENAVGIYALPLGIARNFVVNGRPVLVPMVVEEPSVIAGASFMARLAAANGGFTASTTPPEMIGQIQILDIPDMDLAQSRLLEHREELLQTAATIDPLLSRFGGGPRGIEVRRFDSSPIGSFLVLHLIYDVRDAMGANAINTALEKLAPQVAAISGGRVHLRILSNLADRRLATAHVTIRTQDLAFDNYTGEAVRDGIIEAWAFAEV